MIKLKNLLVENRSTQIDLQTLRKYINNTGMSTNEILRKNIYRGNSGISDNFYYVDPKFSIRKSANTSNYYTLAIDNFPEWKEYPKRSKGIICSSDMFTACEHGTNVYFVIPLSKDTKIGICPTNDIWNSFPAHLQNVNKCIYAGFHATLKYLLNDCDLTPEINNEMILLKKIMHENNYSFDEFTQAFEIVDKYKEKIWDNWGNLSQTKSMNIFYKDENLLKSYEYFLNPDNNGFSIKSFNDYNLSKNTDREVWFDSECVLINKYALSLVF